MGRRQPGGPCYLDLRWSPLPLWGREPCEGCAKKERRRHMDPAAVAFNGTLCGATTRVRAAPQWGGTA
eukprot:8937587-Pyramimonas_sp.AAC.1